MRRLLLPLIMFSLLVPAALGATYTVTNCDDDGIGSLRQAITDANSGPGNTIAFNIPTSDPGYKTEYGTNFFLIMPQTDLPPITQPGTVIDGTTQAANRGVNNPFGPEVEIYGGTNGLEFDSADNCTVEGLTINGFTNAGIYLSSSNGGNILNNYIGVGPTGNFTEPNYNGIFLSYSTGNRIAGNLVSGNDNYGIYLYMGSGNEVVGNYVGCAVNGLAGLGNVYGIVVESSSSEVIGGSAAGEGNLIASNEADGINLYESTGIIILGNFIGTDITGNTALPNANGIFPTDSSSLQIGDGTSGGRNIISGNVWDGLIMFNCSNDNITGNYFGVGSAEGALGNGNVGIYLYGSSPGCFHNMIGPANEIANTGSSGIFIDSGSLYNTITRNSIYDTFGPGIQLNGSANDRIAAPNLETADLHSVTGEAPVNATVEVFSADTERQGRTFLGSTIADGNGLWSLALSLSADTFLTATATDQNGNTSRFSWGLVATGPPATFTVTTTADDGPGSLRQCINNANGAATPETIRFALPNGMATYESGVYFWRIAPISVLPSITREGVVIDGATQPTDGTYNNPYGPVIVLDGSAAGGVNGLTITANNCTIEGLVINYGASGVYINGGSGNQVLGCYLGTDPTGTSAPGNLIGVQIFNGAHNRIGDGTPAGRNLLSGNAWDGVRITDTSNSNEVLGNYIGTTASGEAPLANSQNGVYGLNQSADNLISGNLISGNSGGPGINFSFDCSNNRIMNNKIGCDLSGSSPLPNLVGIWLSTCTGTVIGSAEGRNVISGNTWQGISLLASASTEIVNNYIGTDATGTTAEANLSHGIYANGSSSYNLIKGNVVSGNAQHGIYLDDNSCSNEVLGNMVGVSALGDAVVGNGYSGVAMNNSSYNVVGDGTLAGRNVISGNNYGITANNSSYLTILGNYVGVDVTGAREGFGNMSDGLNLTNGSNIVVGKDTALERNIVSGNAGLGIALGADTNSTVEGNYVGTDVTGNIARPNLNHGIYFWAGGSYNRVVRNVSSGNAQLGIYFVDGPTSNEVLGNMVGVNVSGDTAMGNGSSGIAFSGGFNNVVGDGTLAGRNVIADNGYEGIGTDASTNLTILGNYVGLDVTGTREGFGNHRHGIYLDGGSSNSVIGNDTDLGRNIVGSNAGLGITLVASVNSTVEGNYVGTDKTGTVARPNHDHGIYFRAGASYNRVIRNVSSGNAQLGIYFVDGPTSNEVLGNMVGVNVSGDTAMGNGSTGIAFSGGFNNVVGDGTLAGRNVIADNGYDGIDLGGGGYQTIMGNYIGVDVTGTRPFGNRQYGIFLAGDSTGSRIGPDNIIANSGTEGVLIDGGGTIYNTITRNSIYNSTDLGISLTNGGNTNLAAPIITSLEADPGSGLTKVSGTAEVAGIIELFATGVPNPSGFGEGRTYLGSAAGAGGNWSMLVGPLTDGTTLTATVTDLNGNTSPFSFIYPTPNLVVTNTNASGPGSLRGCINMANSIPGTQPLMISFNIPASDPGMTTEGDVTTWRIQDNGLTITRAGTVIDGTTQTTNQGNTNPYGPEIVMEIEGAGGGWFDACIDIAADNCTVKGLDIAGQFYGGYGFGYGVYLDHTRGCRISGNYLGTDPTGNPMSWANNMVGIYIAGGSSNVIGGSDPGERNLISDNFGNAINFDNTSSNEVLGNYIGTDRTGMNRLGAQLFGALSFSNGSYNNLIGGAGAGEGNLISGNDAAALDFEDGSGHLVRGNQVRGNRIGTDASGSGLCANNTGIHLGAGSAYNLIGGAGAGEGNLISGNYGSGMLIENSSSNEIYGNYIGCDAAGTTPLANASGIDLNNSFSNLIGSGAVAGRNIISGNNDTGIGFYNTGSTGNQVRGNIIGFNATGTAALSNNVYGVYLNGGASLNLIGPDNIIAGNWLTGLKADGSDCLDNTITRNSFHDNNSLGINLTNGANGGIATPMITFADLSVVSGEAPVNSTVEVFATGAYNLSGIAEGRTYLGSTEAGPDGQWTMSFTPELTDGTSLTATATDLNGNTSQFSMNWPAPLTQVINTNDSGPGSLRQAMAYAAVWPNIYITFNIPPDDPGFTTEAGVSFWRIQPLSTLPPVTRAGTVIDGTTQTANQGDTNSSGPEIEIDGSLAGGGIDGLTITANNCTIEGLVIESFNGNGISIESSTGTKLLSNYIGTDATGTFGLGNGNCGIWLENSSNNLIGSTEAGLGNLISGNGASGVNLYGDSSYNQILGNYIGTDVTGMNNNNGLGNVGNAVTICDNCHHNLIGNGQPGGGNVMSGNGFGVYFYAGGNCGSNEVLGNMIGCNSAGDAALPNWSGVVIVYSGVNNLIGDGTAGGRNVISGNNNAGIEIYGDTSNEVLGNYIGVNAAGSAALPNLNGIFINSGSNNLIGDGTPGGGNSISGNLGYGIIVGDVLSGAFGEPVYNRILGNHIGTNAVGDQSLPNGVGIHLSNASTYTTIGDGTAGGSNFIIDNISDGIVIDGTASNDTVSRNSIYNNGGLGIDLTNGANNGIAAPTIAFADLTVASGEAPANSTVEVFATGIPDSSGSGEGQTYLGSTTADGSGQWTMPLSLTDNTTLSATATDTQGDTSMFGWNWPPTLQVINTNDSGPGSLRQAIDYANFWPGFYDITFNIPNSDPGYTTEAGVSFWRIQPLSSLPHVTRAGVVIDGTTQTANQGDTNPSGPEIEIDGSQAGGDGLDILADNCTIEGLGISYFAGDGICLNDVSGCQILNNYIGCDPIGTAGWGNGLHGIYIIGGSGNQIGHNLISGNGQNGIDIEFSSNSSEVYANYIGTDRAGTTSLSNTFYGIYIANGSQYTIIGSAGEGNIISGNPFGEIMIDASGAQYNQVVGNNIGGGTGGVVVGGGTGIIINGSPYNRIGPNNIIANSGPSADDYGVLIAGGASVSNIVTQNSIYNNSGLGIGLLDGANNGITPPTISFANLSVVSGEAPANSTVEVFATGIPDPSGSGEGLTYLGSTTADGSGQWTMPLALTDNTPLSATATDPQGDTSMFAFNFFAFDPYIVTTTADSGIGSLRQCLINANAAPGRQTITFNIPTAEATFDSGAWFWQIQPSGPLPAISEEVVVNGFSQPTDETYNNPFGPVIELSGPGVSQYGTGSFDGLTILAANCTIEGLVINQFQNGILITGEAAGHNNIRGNYLGCDPAGATALHNYCGINILDNSSYNLIGDGTAGGANLIAGNVGAYGSYGYALIINGANSNEVLGNNIGTITAAGTELGNGDGIMIENCSYNLIGDGTAGGGNIICGSSSGLAIDYSGTSNEVLGNSFSKTEYVPALGYPVILPNQTAIVIGGAYNLIGNGLAGGGNDISYNGTGVYFDSQGSNSNEVLGNNIGGNQAGVEIDWGSYNLIGNGTAGGRNVISGNFWGFYLAGASNEVLGNYIGVNAAGDTASGNIVGIQLNGDFNQIGGSAPGEGNVISGNINYGIIIYSVSNEVLGNYIGTNAAGDAAIPNQIYALALGGDYWQPTTFDPYRNMFPPANISYNQIGDGTAGGRNLISGNGGSGLYIGVGFNSTKVLGNYIGLGAAGTPLGNNGNGILVLGGGGAPNQIGAGNEIAYNGASGVRVEGAGAFNNTITQNLFHDNNSRGILLAGGNHGLAAPVIAYAGTNLTTGSTEVGGTAVPGMTIELFLTGGPDPTGYYEGRNYLTSTFEASGSWTISLPPLTTGTTLTATATDQQGNTSQFSAPVAAYEQPAVAIITPAGGKLYPKDKDQSVSWKILGMPLTTANLYYSLDSGADYQLIASGVSATAPYTWHLPDLTTTEARIKVEALNGSYLATGETADFTITEAQTLEVTNTQDDGEGSLRQMIIYANTLPNLNTIVFNIPTSDPGYDPSAEVWRISPLTPLPPLTRAGVAIDGTTQPTDESHYNPNGPEIMIDGTAAGEGANGLEITANNCTIEGLAIAHFNGIGIHLNNVSGTKVLGSYIGCDPAGATAEADLYYGIFVDGGSANQIGDGTMRGRNLISGNSAAWSGLEIDNSTGNYVLGNYIGTDTGGTNNLGNDNGIALDNSSYNYIGGSAAGQGNLISGNSVGINLADNSVSNEVLGNLIGTTVSGEAVLPNEEGLMLDSSSSNLIGSGQAGGQNVIAGSSFAGIFMNDSSGNQMLGNCIGIDAAGDAPLPNENGILVFSGSANLIGDGTPGGRNIISGNRVEGIVLSGTASNEILGNYLGVNAAGTAARANSENGIYLDDSSFNLIGSGQPGGRNIISGSYQGIYLIDSSSNEVFGNYIGTDAAGLTAIGNNTGIEMQDGANNNMIGGSAAGQGNVISGNGGYGIEFHWGATATGNEVLGNYIGCKADGSGPLPGTYAGIYFMGGAYTRIGDGTSGGRNIISGNSNGMVIDNAPNTVYNRIEGNYIGVGPTGAAMGNSGNGLQIWQGPGNLFIANNIIANSGSDGIKIDSSTGNTISQNSIYDNGGLGINLTDGANNLIAAPAISFASLSSVSGEAPANSTVEVFATGTPDPIGSGEGQTYLGSVIADGSGQWSMPLLLSSITTLSATATDQQGDTSMFGWNWPPPLKVINTFDDGRAGSLRQIITAANADPSLNRVEFDIPASDPGYVTENGVSFWRIQLLSPLAISRAGVVIDGTTQTANQGDTNPSGPEIMIDGSQLSGGTCITINANACTVEGLVIGNGSEGLHLRYASGCQILGNYIGTDPSGANPQANNLGIYLEGSPNTIIGNGTAAGRNVISCSSFHGLDINTDSDSCEVLGNYIGTDASGSNSLPNNIGIFLGSNSNLIGNGTAGGRNVISGNSGNGIDGGAGVWNRILGNYIGCQANGLNPLGNYEGIGFVYTSNCVIGDGTPGGRNVISGNVDCGVFLFDSISNEVTGNYIGCQADGIGSLGNGTSGVHINSDDSLNTASYNLIGVNNTIAYNGLYGVQLTIADGSGGIAQGNTITRNSIHDNGDLGIMLEGGANQGIAAPTIGSATWSVITGEAPANATVEVFATGIPDPSGSGEGQTYLGSTIANGSGNWSLTLGAPLTGDTTLSATATDTQGDTSMFGWNYIATPLLVPLSITRQADTVGSDVIVSWPTIATPDVYALTGDGTGIYTNEASRWTQVTNTNPVSGFSVSGNQLHHTGQVRAGSGEAYYKALKAGEGAGELISAEAVGKFNVALGTGLSNLSALPLIQSNPGINSVIGGQLPAGTKLSTRDPSGRWDEVICNGGSWSTNLSLEADRGFWLNVASGTPTLTLVGSVFSGTERTLTLYNGLNNLLGSAYPLPVGLDNSLLGAALGGSGGSLHAFELGVWYEPAYNGSTWSSLAYKLKPGKGFWVNRTGSGTSVWHYPRLY